MRKIKKIMKGIMASNPTIPIVIDKSRIYMAYMAWFEFACIIFYLAIAGRTNQSSIVSGFVLQSLVCTCSGLYIHFGTKMKYFYKSIQFMLGGQVYMFILIIRMVTCFSATSAACRLVANYYNKTEQGSQSRTACVMNQIIYYVWAAVCLATIIIRIFALQYLVRSYKFLARKARDKEKRKEHELDRKRKERRRRKRAL